MTESIKISDVKFGVLNPMGDSGVDDSFDRRRSTLVNYLQKAISDAYQIDILKKIDVYQGIIVASYVKERAATPDPQSKLKNFQKGLTLFEPEGVTVYKVYIPELEPRPAPKSSQDPVLTTYQDILPDANLFPTGLFGGTETFEIGQIVGIRFTDFENLSDPRIVSAGEVLNMEDFDKADGAGGTESGHSSGRPVVGRARRGGRLPGKVGKGARNKGGQASSYVHRNVTFVSLAEMKEEQKCYDNNDKIPMKSQHAPKLEIMHPNIRPYAKVWLCRVWERKGIKIQLNSSYRTIATQQRLWNAYVKRGYGPRPANPAKSLSMHNYGLAIDFNPILPEIGMIKSSYSDTMIWHTSGMVSIAEEIGLRWGGYFGNNWDPIHFDYRNYITGETKDAIDKIARGDHAPPGNRIEIPA